MILLTISLARLQIVSQRRCRLLQVAEPPKRMRIDAALLKSLTGRDTITARHLYQSEFEFTPCFKLFINTNYLPVVLDDTVFSSGRFKVITFDRHFDEQEQDKNLKDRLITEENLSGILNWLLEGNRRYRGDTNALRPPKSVVAATDEYRLNSDKMQNFFNDCFEEDAKTVLPASDIYMVYQKWCKDNGYGTENKTNFFKELKGKLFYREHGTVNGKTVRNVIIGYRLDQYSNQLPC